jgi:hypothetical protein
MNPPPKASVSALVLSAIVVVCVCGQKMLLCTEQKRTNFQRNVRIVCSTLLRLASSVNQLSRINGMPCLVCNVSGCTVTLQPRE